jgi:hypothetical protein
MNRLANIFIGLGLFVGMIAMYVLGTVTMILFMLPIMSFFLIVFVLAVLVGEVFLVLFALVWLIVGLVGLLTTGSTSWLKHLRISNMESKVDKGFDICFWPMMWWMDHLVDPVAIDGILEAGEHCRKRLIKNGDFTNE